MEVHQKVSILLYPKLLYVRNNENSLSFKNQEHQRRIKAIALLRNDCKKPISETFVIDDEQQISD